MGFLDRILKAFAGGAKVAEPGHEQWVYVECSRCREPLRARIDMRNELSLDDDGESYVVRKGLVGSGKLRCFQTVDITLNFDAKKQVTGREIVGGRFITAEEYDTAAAAWPPPEEQDEDA